ncbi:efflux transporter outer membrane subunit [Sphingomonas sp. MMS24-J13]|uniref:efflux transporter outer membrane subunit n=1 Tax=Sphingomonas sp. MMS24-J13 TaxID=3238686 RepID=UPI00384F04D0
MRKSAFATLSLSLALAGCAVGPDYHRPVAPVSGSFVAQPRVAERTAATPASLDTWWDGFQDPLLSDLVKRALQNNLDIAQAAARITQARASLRTANAALLPSGQVTGSAAHAHQSLETPSGRAFSNLPGFQRDGEVYEADLGASWEIDVFGGLRRGQEAARADYQASEANAAGVRIAIAAQTADTYITIRGLQSRIAIAEQQVETQRRLVALVDLQYRKGIAAELQLRQAEGALAQIEATLPALRTGLDAAMNALDVLIGVQPGTDRTLLMASSPVPTPPAIADAGGPADLLRRRPDLIAAERHLAASNARIGEAVAEYYPKFTISGLIGTATMGAGNVFTGGANQAQGVFGLRWRLFDFGRVDAEIAAARGSNAEALAAYRLAALRASEDVEDAFSALVEREAQERVLAGGEASLTRASAASLAAYKGGVVSLIEVLDADSRLLATRDARAQAKTEAARAAVASFRSLGGGWR